MSIANAQEWKHLLDKPFFRSKKNGKMKSKIWKMVFKKTWINPFYSSLEPIQTIQITIKKILCSKASLDTCRAILIEI